MSRTAHKSHPKLWDTVKTEVTRSGKGGGPGQWSTRNAQMAVQEHEKRGAVIRGGDEEDTSLRKWTNGQSAGGGDDTEAEEPGRGELMAECGRVDTRQ